MSASKNDEGNSVVDKFSSPEEMILKQITSKEKGFISTLKNIRTVDGVVRFLEREGIRVDESAAQKLIIALQYFDVDSSGKIECNDSLDSLDSLEDIHGGVDSNPFIGLFRSLV